ncbi:hypothetical protein CYG49_04395 [Candidatus Saccharibacteria bacterium]|nr:MAG: hypothetical protein CYG49_04395 [Candidatus Saccharibacteria bacterium]
MDKDPSLNPRTELDPATQEELRELFSKTRDFLLQEGSLINEPSLAQHQLAQPENDPTWAFRPAFAYELTPEELHDAGFDGEWDGVTVEFETEAIGMMDSPHEDKPLIGFRFVSYEDVPGFEADLHHLIMVEDGGHELDVLLHEDLRDPETGKGLAVIIDARTAHEKQKLGAHPLTSRDCQKLLRFLSAKSS